MIESIALNMVVYNEGHRIRDTLWLAAEHVNEMVIVDQASTDNTVEEINNFWNEAVCSDIELHSLLIVDDRHWGYCEPSRKLAASKTLANWILVLDADERISDEFASEIRSIDEKGFKGVRLKRSLWVSGVHYWTGDYQYRFFNRKAVKFLDEIHTEPQPTVHKDRIYAPDYVGIWHTKSWTEQARDEEAYDEIIRRNNESDVAKERKLALNVYSGLLAAAGLSAEEADRLTPEEREELGIGPTYHFDG